MCTLPQASMTNESLTETHATTSTPLALSASNFSTKPGRCVYGRRQTQFVRRREEREGRGTGTLLQPGVNAPGTPNKTPFRKKK